MGSFFVALFNFFYRRKLALHLLFIVTIGVFGFYAAKLKIQEDIMQLFPQGKDMSRLRSFLEQSQFSDKVILTVSHKSERSGQDVSQLLQLSESISNEISEGLHEYVQKVEYRIEDTTSQRLYHLVNDHLPYFLDEKDYAKIDSITSVKGIANAVARNYEILASPSGMVLGDQIKNDPLGLNYFVLEKFELLNKGSGIGVVDGFFATMDQQNAIVVITPKHPSRNTEKNTILFHKLDELIESELKDKPTFQVHYFGAPVVASGNARQIRFDSLLTVSLTLIFLFIIFFLFFRNFHYPILVLIPLVFGTFFALGGIYFLKGSISIISLGSGALVLGIAVNYSLHFLAHLLHNPDKRSAIKELSFPMIAGSLTTICGFLCLQFVDAPVLQDLGVFAALSLSGAAIATLVFLPHMVPTAGSTLNKEVKKAPNRFAEYVNTRIYGNRRIAIFILILTPLFLYFAFRVEFETELNQLNYMSDKTRQAEGYINQITNYYRKSVYVIHTGKTLDEALMGSFQSRKELEARSAFENNKIEYADISTILPPSEIQKSRIDRWNDYWTYEKVNDVHSGLMLEGSKFKFKSTAFDGFRTQINANYFPIDTSELVFLQEALLPNRIYQKNDLFHVVDLAKGDTVTLSGLSSFLPDSDRRFIVDRQQVNDRLIESVRGDFNSIALITSMMVFLALLVIHGRIELAIIAVLPLVISWIWILGLMSLLGLEFNSVNIILSTLIFALGDDFCIFTSDGLKESYKKRGRSNTPIISSISLSAICTIAGIGVLALAEHPALKSLAIVSVIGIGSVWLMSQVLQPVLFKFLISNPTNQGHEPYTFYNILKSIFAFSYFLFGSILICIIAILFFILMPFKSRRKKLVFHYIMQRFAWSMIYIMNNVKKQIFNELKEDFKTPSVIIANHSSFLDILLLIMLYPKMILLTNKWVWNSPVFGIAIRLAEYYHVSDGAENLIPHLKDKVADGYSIVVFPEGTRSVDGKIQRFHKGAFYIAEQLQMDILPILIHGANFTMTKGFFYLKNGQLSLKVLPRIQFDDTRFGIELRDRTKNISKYFKDRHAEFSEQMETPRYFRQTIFSNYLYKGPVVEWYTKIKCRLEDDYNLLNSKIPRDAKILDIGCGYGYLSYILGLTSFRRNITGIDYDEEKIEVAESGYAKPQNVQFVYSDAMSYEMSDADVIVLSDMLHYLSPKNQLELLKKCVNTLSVNGFIVIRDGIVDDGSKHLNTKLTEWISTRLMRFNKRNVEKLTFLTKSWIESFALENNLSLEAYKLSTITSNTFFILHKRS